MKHLLAAAACAPLLLACASAGAQTANTDNDRETRILVINGERIVLDENSDAADAIEQAINDASQGNRIVLEFDGEDGDSTWTADQRSAFAQAMAGLTVMFGDGFANDFDFDFEFDEDFSFDGEYDFDVDGEDVRIHVERIERDAERAAEMAERHAERAERHAERMAEHVERHVERIARHAEHHAERMATRVEIQARHAERMGERMAVQGLAAGVRGMEAGIHGLDRILERGWYEDDGERVELTVEKRAELEETRAELADDLVDLREELDEMSARLGAEREHRDIRIERRNDSVRAWVNGEEVTGSALDDLLEGAPEAPEPPQPVEPVQPPRG